MLQYTLGSLLLLVELLRSQVPRSLIAVLINSGFEEETAQNQFTNKGVNKLKIRLVNLVKISRCLVHNPERTNLAMGGRPRSESQMAEAVGARAMLECRWVGTEGI